MMEFVIHISVGIPIKSGEENQVIVKYTRLLLIQEVSSYLVLKLNHPLSIQSHEIHSK